MEKIVLIIANLAIHAEFCAAFTVMCFIKPADMFWFIVVAILWILAAAGFSIFAIGMQKARKKFC